MSSPTEHWNLNIGPISCHAWNKDRTQLAVSASNSVIHIFKRPANSSGQWRETHVLREHELIVTGLDWAPNTNRIVSCSQDKNAFVWTFDAGEWRPELVVVRSSRAATSVKWSPQENKFAVATGAKLVSVCFYEKENNWWVAKQIKKSIYSTVTAIDWHPNNNLLAVGACDFKTRVFSAYIKEVDTKPEPNPWGSKMPFGALLAEYSSTGWVHAVAFSPSGCQLTWCSHDSTLAVVNKAMAMCAGDQPILCRTVGLPFRTLCWMGENRIIAAGYDCSPVLFSVDVEEGTRKPVLAMLSKLGVPAPEDHTNANVGNVFRMFRNTDRTANAEESTSGQLKTLHQNAITEVQIHTGRPDNVTKFSTCGTDGLVAIWDLKSQPSGIGLKSR